VVADMLTLTADALSARAIKAAGVAGSVTGGAGPRNHMQLRRMAAAVARDPAAPSDFFDDPDASPHQRADLAQRYGVLRNAGESLLAELLRQAGAGGSANGRAAALSAARSWGIRPLEQASAAEDVQRCADAASVLGARLNALPSRAEVGELDLVRIAERLATLATEDGHLPILSVVPMPATSGVVAAPVGASGLSELEEQWLSVVSAVREPMARIETMQLDALLAGTDLLSVWTDRPDDVWQMAAPREADGRRLGSSLHVIFGPAGVLDAVTDQTPVALGRIDSWAERIPEKEQTAGMSFNFNAPSARAQNAILVIAPPQMHGSLNSKALLDALRGARALARARMLPADAVGEFASAVSTAILPAGNGMTDRLTGKN